MGRAGDGRSGLDLLSVVAAVVLFAGLVQVFAGAVRVGVTWDEATHVGRTESLLDVGWFVPEWQLDNGEPDGVSAFVYGPAFSVTAHTANLVAGNEEPGETSGSAEAYVVRHLTSATLGFLTILAVGLMAWTIIGSRRAGLFGAAALAAIPAWTGHAMFNVKDVPAAAGYTLVTAGLVLALVPADGRLGGRTRLVSAGVAVAIGVFFGVGTRLALWLPVGLSLWSFALVRLVQRHGGGRRSAAPSLTVAGGAVAGLAGIVAIYTQAFANPVSLISGSVAGSSAYPWSGVTLTAGQLLHSLDLPWWYLPAWLFARMPILLLVFAMAGLATAAAWLVRRVPGERWWEVPGTAGGALLVAQQALLLPLAAMAVGSGMYDGIRQHLYVLPAVAVLIAVGAERLYRWSADADTHPWLRRMGMTLLTIALLPPTLEQALLFPYNYTYVNLVAGIGGVDGRWETDYWKASGREAVTRVPEDVELLCSGLVRPGLPEGLHSVPCRADVTTYQHLRGTAVVSSPAISRQDEDVAWVIGYRRQGNRPPEHCQSIDDVTRWLRGEEVVMAHVLVCDRDGF